MNGTEVILVSLFFGSVCGLAIFYFWRGMEE